VPVNPRFSACPCSGRPGRAGVTAAPLQQNKPVGRGWSPSSKQSGVREKASTALPEAAAQTLAPLRHPRSNTSDPIQPMSHPPVRAGQNDFGSSGTQSAPPLCRIRGQANGATCGPAPLLHGPSKT